MNLYIQIENDQPINHPILMDNLIEAFGRVPGGWEQFIRMQRPEVGIYQVLDSEEPTYQKQLGYWMDVWALRDMTAEEKAAKQQAVRDEFSSREQAVNWSAWVLDEATCTMQPPITRPEPNLEKLNAGVYTFWCGADGGWKDTPAKPVDNNQYNFDFLAWQWVQVVN
jgi:hypothetical protein